MNVAVTCCEGRPPADASRARSCHAASTTSQPPRWDVPVLMMCVRQVAVPAGVLAQRPNPRNYAKPNRWRPSHVIPGHTTPRMITLRRRTSATSQFTSSSSLPALFPSWPFLATALPSGPRRRAPTTLLSPRWWRYNVVTTLLGRCCRPWCLRLRTRIGPTRRRPQRAACSITSLRVALCHKLPQLKLQYMNTPKRITPNAKSTQPMALSHLTTRFRQPPTAPALRFVAPGTFILLSSCSIALSAARVL